MTYGQAIVLAVVQGATEFLPISSSGHLVLLPFLFHWPDQGLSADVAVNTGTLLAVLLYLRHDVARLAGAAVGGLRGGGDGRPAGGGLDVSARLAWALLLATVPVAVAGFAGHGVIALGGRDPAVIAITSIGFGLLLWWADHRGRQQRSLDDLAWRDAVLVGLAQALALVPGTSRAGITITAALVLGFDRASAARFSLLLAIPVGVLAGAKEFADAANGGGWPGALLPLALAFVLSAVVAYLSIGWLLAWVERQSLTAFAVYRILLGLVIFAVLV